MTLVQRISDLKKRIVSDGYLLIEGHLISKEILDTKSEKRKNFR